MKKLLHERLRRLTDDDACFVCADNFEASISRKAGEHLADEIERYYIPRPRFEDGELIKNGDPTLHGTAHFVDVALDGSYALSELHHNEPFFIGDPEELIPRPSEALDADGVEIKSGDKVWTLDGKDTGKVIEVGAIHSLLIQESNAHWINNDQLTHKEPDSIQKVIDYLNDCGNSDPSGLYYVAADRLSALIEKVE